MAKYIAKRVLISIVTLWVLVTVVLSWCAVCREILFRGTK